MPALERNPYVTGEKVTKVQRTQLAANIKELRKYQNMTQKELSKRAQISERVIIWLERAKPDYRPELQTLLALMNALNSNVNQLFKGMD